MRRRTLLLLPLWLLAGASVAGAEPIELFMIGTRNSAGQVEQFTYAVDTAHIVKLPHWSPADAAPPQVEYGRALEIVRAKIERSLPPQKDWKFQSIQLQHGTKPASNSVWYYQFEIDVFPRGGNVGDGMILWTIVLLMDGTLLAPDPFK